MSFAQLICASALAERLNDPQVVIFDCRFALTDPAYGLSAYQKAHLPNAHFLDLEKDLSAQVVKGVTGRHPLPNPETLSQTLATLGLNQDSTVVLYDDDNGAFAARAWWLLLWLGKTADVYVLDGGFNAWQKANGPVTQKLSQPQEGNFTASVNPDLLVQADEVLSLISNEQAALFDARALPRFKGEVEPLDPVAGHIPTAVCLPFTENVDEQGHFLTPELLAERFKALNQHALKIAYCGSGVTACHNIFAMDLAGLGLAKLYAGSWSEWINSPDRPVARG